MFADMDVAQRLFYIPLPHGAPYYRGQKLWKTLWKNPFYCRGDRVTLHPLITKKSLKYFEKYLESPVGKRLYALPKVKADLTYRGSKPQKVIHKSVDNITIL